MAITFLSKTEPPFSERVAGKINKPDILECSTSSENQIGKQLSAFNLRFSTPAGRTISVESAYQGSKVFEKGGPFQDIYDKSSREAKTDPRVRTHGRITSFQFFNRKMPAMPLNAFYNWLYISTIIRAEPDIAAMLEPYRGFTDQFFNPNRGRSCQAEAVSMIKGLSRHGLLTEEYMKDWRKFYQLSEELIKM